MRISDMLASRQTLSYEIFPPKGELPIAHAVNIACKLAVNHPDWISVTFSAGGSSNNANTFAIANTIQRDIGVTALAHLTCMGATTADIDAHLATVAATGIDNILALRGDRTPERDVVDFAYAADLITYIKRKDPTLCVGAACYPEGHVECRSRALDLEHLKAKQDAGADFLVTQLFFDNADFYRFRDACVRARIKLPIVCGIMPFTSVKQIQRMAFTCGASIPARVIRRLAAAGDDAEAQRSAGVSYACEQLSDLAANGVDGVHIYTMNRPDVGAATAAALAACGYPHT